MRLASRRATRRTLLVPDLIEAVMRSGAGSFIGRDATGFDYHVGERGGRLSGGQRSFLVMARALVEPCRVLFLDEPTGAMGEIAGHLHPKARVAMRGRLWGSVHDRMSGPTLETIAEGSALPVRHPDWHDQHWLTQLNAQSPWLDHLTHSVFPTGVSVQDFAWNFSPRYRHWLQAAWVRP